MHFQCIVVELGIGLDAEFLLDYRETGAGRPYEGQKPYPWIYDGEIEKPVNEPEITTVELKIRSLLLDRFRLKDTIEIPEPISNLNAEQDYIVSSINKQQPVLLNLFGYYEDDHNEIAGHTAIIDAYRISGDGIDVKINMGWGKEASASRNWYSGQSGISVPDNNGDPWLFFDEFRIFKNTVPINYNQ